MPVSRSTTTTHRDQPVNCPAATDRQSPLTVERSALDEFSLRIAPSGWEGRREAARGLPDFELRDLCEQFDVAQPDDRATVDELRTLVCEQLAPRVVEALDEALRGDCLPTLRDSDGRLPSLVPRPAEGWRPENAFPRAAGQSYEQRARCAAWWSTHMVIEEALYDLGACDPDDDEVRHARRIACFTISPRQGRPTTQPARRGPTPAGRSSRRITPRARQHRSKRRSHASTHSVGGDDPPAPPPPPAGCGGFLTV